MSPDDNRRTEPRPQPAEPFSEWLHSWRYLFCFLGLVGLVLLFYAEENWRGYRAWESYKQQMTARGAQFEPAAFIPPRVSDDENFAMTPALAPMFEFVAGTQHWRDTNAPRRFQDLTAKYDAAARLANPRSVGSVNSWIRARTDLGLWAAAFLQGTNSHPHTGESPLSTHFTSRDAATAVLQDLLDFNPVLDELRTASQRPHARFNLRYEESNPAAILLPHLSRIKYFCQVLQLRASAELALDRMDDARQDLELMFRLTDATRKEPILISQLVRMAELQLALAPLAEGMGQWSEAQLRALQERLQAFDFCADLNRSLQAERVLFGDGVIEYVRRSHNKFDLMDEFSRVSDGSSSSPIWPMAVLTTAAPSGWLYLEQLNHSVAFDQYLLPLIDVTNRKIRPTAVRDANDAISRLTQRSPVDSLLHHQFFSGLLLPAISRVAEKAAFAQTAVDTATVACALERYRLAHGQLPDSLDNLTPQFIARLPHDIINGKPLIYRHAPDGHYLLYSVGWNETDDGGSPKQKKTGDAERQEGDWVWGDNF